MGWVGEGVHALLQTALAFVQVAVRARQVVLSGLPLLLPLVSAGRIHLVRLGPSLK